MRILIIRHAEPDYSVDSLTEKGWREARLLTDRLRQTSIDTIYCSPLGRAKDTISLYLAETGKEASTCDWLREFHTQIDRPDHRNRKSGAWDWLPADWTAQEEFFRRDLWWTHPAMADGNVKKEYDWVTNSLDQLLANHGYQRHGEYYQATRPNRDTIAFVCHFGVECVLLSRLINTSPMTLWHHFCALPSSVTTLYTEERREGAAIFRATGFGDLSHLYAGGEEPSFMARFCETYNDNHEERRDD